MGVLAEPEHASEEDKRVQMYKHMRDDLLREESKAKSDFQNKKLEEVSNKMAQIDMTRKIKEDQIR